MQPFRQRKVIRAGAIACLLIVQIIAVARGYFGAQAQGYFGARAQASATSATQWYGVNLSGMEFTDHTTPGIYDKDYTMPTAQEVAYYAGKGLRLIRLPLLWERMQDGLYGPLDAANIARVDSLVNAAAANNAEVLLDIHNYGQYVANGSGSLVGSTQIPSSAFVDLWGKLAAHFAGRPGLYGYDLMNEPRESSWPQDAQAALNAIRQSDRTSAVVVEAYVGCNPPSFTVADPANNLVYSEHCYFDGNNSGTYPVPYDQQSNASATIGVARVTPFITWLRANHARGLLGEFGIPNADGANPSDNDREWLTVLDNFLATLKSSSDVIVGVTYWGGGPWWGGYPLSTEPGNLGQSTPQDAIQMSVLEKYTTTTSAAAPATASPTATLVPPSATAPNVPPSNTPVPPSNTLVPPSNTPAPPSNTPAPPSNTPAPNRSMTASPTATLVPPSATAPNMPPSNTPVPPSATAPNIPPSNTPAPITRPVTNGPVTNKPAPAPAPLFATGFEGGAPQPTWTNTIDGGGYPAGGVANIAGICCGLSGPEAGMRVEAAHTGGAALMYSGQDTSAGTSYAYAKVFDLSGKRIVVGPSTTLSYWIYPQSGHTSPVAVGGANSTCVSVDLIFTDGHNLRDSGAVDQNGKRLHPAAQCGHLTPDAWNHVTSVIGAKVAGKTIARLDVGYDQPANTGGYRGYIDDLSIHN